MNSLLILVLAVGLAAGDVGLGYNYRPPTFATYGVPSYQASASSGQYNVDLNNANGLNYKVIGQNPTTGYQGSSFGFQNGANTVYRGNGGYQGFRPATSGYQNNYQGIYNGGNVHRETVQYQGGQSQYQGGQSQYQGGQSQYQGGQPQYHGGQSQYQGGQFGNYAHQNEVNKGSYQNTYELSSQQPQIFKHFYVHAAPEDEEPPKPRTPIVLPPPQKHYKIIFIKAPTQAASAPQVIPIPQQTEEKTIVYVLVNKPEDAKNVVLPKLDQKPPVKPEVFFIKYNNKDGSQAVIDNIVKDYNKGQSVSFTNVGSGVPPPPSLLLGTYGKPGVQGGNGGIAASSAPQIVSNSGFGVSNTESQSESSFASKPFALGVPAVSDGTLASTFVGTGTTASSNVDNGYSSATSGTGYNGVSSSAGFNGVSNNGAGYNTATSSTGYNTASSSTGLPGASSIVFNGVSGDAGFNSGSSGNVYNNEVSSISTVSPLPDSEYNGSTITSIQGVPHETYGIPKFRV